MNTRHRRQVALGVILIALSVAPWAFADWTYYKTPPTDPGPSYAGLVITDDAGGDEDQILLPAHADTAIFQGGSGRYAAYFEEETDVNGNTYYDLVFATHMYNDTWSVEDTGISVPYDNGYTPPTNWGVSNLRVSLAVTSSGSPVIAYAYDVLLADSLAVLSDRYQYVMCVWKSGANWVAPSTVDTWQPYPYDYPHNGPLEGDFTQLQISLALRRDNVPVVGYTQNSCCSFWDADEGKYLCTYRSRINCKYQNGANWTDLVGSTIGNSISECYLGDPQIWNKNTDISLDMDPSASSAATECRIAYSGHHRGQSPIMDCVFYLYWNPSNLRWIKEVPYWTTTVKSAWTQNDASVALAMANDGTAHVAFQNNEDSDDDSHTYYTKRTAPSTWTAKQDVVSSWPEGWYRTKLGDIDLDYSQRPCVALMWYDSDGYEHLGCYVARAADSWAYNANNIVFGTVYAADWRPRLSTGGYYGLVSCATERISFPLPSTSFGAMAMGTLY